MSSCCLELRNQNLSQNQSDCIPRLTLVERVETQARTKAMQLRKTLRFYAPAARSLLELALIATALLSFAFMT